MEHIVTKCQNNVKRYAVTKSPLYSIRYAAHLLLGELKQGRKLEEGLHSCKQELVLLFKGRHAPQPAASRG